MPLYAYFHQISGVDSPMTLPVPMMNILNGGKKHAEELDIAKFADHAGRRPVLQ